LGDPSTSLNLKLNSPYFDLFTFVRGLSGDRTPFRPFPASHLKPQPSAKNIAKVGGAGLQLRQGMDKKYISYDLSKKVIDWKTSWFYLENHTPKLPKRTPGTPRIRLE